MDNSTEGLRRISTAVVRTFQSSSVRCSAASLGFRNLVYLLETFRSSSFSSSSSSSASSMIAKKRIFINQLATKKQKDDGIFLRSKIDHSNVIDELRLIMSNGGSGEGNLFNIISSINNNIKVPEICFGSSSPRHFSSWAASWPSSEEAAYVFGKLRKDIIKKKRKELNQDDFDIPGTLDIALDKDWRGPKCSESLQRDLTFEDFMETTKYLQLDLSEIEMERIFKDTDIDKDGKISLADFQSASISSPFLRALVRAISSPKRENYCPFEIPSNFDYTKSTADNYATGKQHVGEHVEIRKKLDSRFHSIYIEQRQYWQDELINRSVLLDDGNREKTNPWLILTCGRMGSGKGYVLGWLSAQGYVPLEHISKVDPDHFKMNMPEWPKYLESDSPRLAGTMTHKESGYIAEIAQEVAMQQRMNVWVDGSLRNGEWYAAKFDRIRKVHPDYKIGIIYVRASDAKIRKRLDQRWKETGRYIPDEIQMAQFRDKTSQSLPILIPKVDFVARVWNDDMPLLEAVEAVDMTGNWEAVRRVFN